MRASHSDFSAPGVEVVVVALAGGGEKALRETLQVGGKGLEVVCRDVEE